MRPVIIKAKGVYDTLKVRGCAGWGCVIFPTEGSWTGAGGAIAHPVAGSTEAELTAIDHALNLAIARKIVRAGALVEIHTDAREVAAVLLHVIPESILDGTNRIDPAVEVRKDLRRCKALEDIIHLAHQYELDITLRIEKGDPRAKAAARAGMEELRERSA
jgi:ribonuclease HI